MWSTLFAFTFLIAVGLSLAAIRLNFWQTLLSKVYKIKLRLSDTAKAIWPVN